MRPSTVPSALCLIALAVLSACGGGKGAPVAVVADVPAVEAAVATANKLSGSVAVGAPISNGMLRILDGDGAVVAADVPIDSDGRYAAVTLTGPAPWRIEACGNAGSNYVCVYSVATEAGVANVTPLTTATVLLASRAQPETLMSGSSPGLSVASIAGAQDQLRAGLAGVLADAGVGGGFDFVSGSLDAGSRSGYDRVLDAVGVSTGRDAQPFVQITPRLGTGNLYLEPGSSSGSVTVEAGAATLELGGIETLFANMSRALASAAACADPASGMRSQLAGAARLQMGPQTAEGAEPVAQALCGYFAGADGAGQMWGARLLSPTLGRCDTSSGANPVCRVSFVIQTPEGDVQAVGSGLGATRESGVWKFAGDVDPIALRASARVQRGVRVDGAVPVETFARALAFEVPAVPGLACAKVSQHSSDAGMVAIGYYKPHAADEPQRLSLWTTDGFGNAPSLDPQNGNTRGADDTWIGLPDGSAGDAVVRNFYRGGRSVTFSLYSNADCSVPLLIAGRSEFEVEVEGVPPVSSALAGLPWPELDAASASALGSLSLAAGATGSYSATWTFPRGVVGVDGATFCGDQADCGEGSAGRLAAREFRPGSRGTTLRLQNSASALATDARKMLALYGKTGDGIGMQTNFMSCPAQAAGEMCR